jgi:hypothetical protein
MHAPFAVVCALFLSTFILYRYMVEKKIPLQAMEAEAKKALR